jgi:hypothetical protein
LEVTKVLRAYVAKETDRERVAKATGLKLVDVHAAETRSAPVMRSAEELLAVEGLEVFGQDAKAIKLAISAVRAKGGNIVEIQTGRLCGDGAEMLAEALERIWGMRRRGHPNLRKAALNTAKKRTADGRCSKARLFELWGSSDDIAGVVSKSGWPQSSIYRHFKLSGVTRELARLEMANRRKALRKVKR